MARKDKPTSSEEMIRAARDELDVGDASAQMVDAARQDVEERIKRDRTGPADPREAAPPGAVPDVGERTRPEASPDNLVTIVREQARRTEKDRGDQQAASRPPRPGSPVPGPVATTTSSRRRVIPVIVGVLILLSLVSRIFDDGSSDSTPVPPPTISVTVATQPPPIVEGEGSAEINIGQHTLDLVRFEFTASGVEPEASGRILATGPIRISTDDWLIDGSMHCVGDLSPFPSARGGGEGVWEVRFLVIESNYEFLPNGKYGSLYVKDDPAGDAIYMIDASISWDDTTCGPRGTLEMFPLLEGDIKIHQ